MGTATLLVVTDYSSEIPTLLRLAGYRYRLLQSTSRRWQTLQTHSECAVVIVDVQRHLQHALIFREKLVEQKRIIPFLFVLDRVEASVSSSTFRRSDILFRPVTLHNLSTFVDEALLSVDSYRAYCLSREYRSRLETLSERERRIVQLAANGASNRGIAAHLELCVKTIEKHRSHAYQKLGVFDLAQMTRLVTLANLDSIFSRRDNEPLRRRAG